MPEKHFLLVVDGIVNLALGILLMYFPVQMTVSIDLPGVETYCYVNILAAVLFGIGLALLLELGVTQLNRSCPKNEQRSD